MVSALDKKLLRDLWALRGQALAIALVIGSGLAVFVMSLGALTSLEQTREAYYERAGFADVFATLKRAPEHVADRLEAVAGVQTLETRIVRDVVLDVRGFEEPITGRLVSLPDVDAPLLNQPVLRRGRLPTPSSTDEVALSEAFADAHGLDPGDEIDANLNENRQRLVIVGIVLSPEYVYALPPGALMPDDLRFAVGWTSRRLLEAAFDMEGAFNDLAIRLGQGGVEAAVIAAVDRELAIYGGVGAVGRVDQLSNWFLDSEIRQLRTLATVMPAIFMAVAAFLLQMATSRLVAMEREQIGLFKAFGYRNRAVAWHYVKLALVIAAIGTALGILGGWWLGLQITITYAEQFRFPFLNYRLDPAVATAAALISFTVASIGALTAVRRAVRLRPAEAMRAEPPPTFARQGPDIPRSLRLDTLTTIVVRQILRWPVRASMTTLGVAAAAALLVTSLHWVDSIEALMDAHFEQTERHDVQIAFAEVEDSDALYAARQFPGVLKAEPVRSAAAEIHAGARRHRGSVEGLAEGGELLSVRDVERGQLNVTSAGLLIGSELARKLAVDPGDHVELRLLHGRRERFDIRVEGVFDTYIGTPAYLDLDRLNELAGEGDAISGARLLVDPAQRSNFFAEVKETAAIAAVSSKDAAQRTFDETLAETINFIVGFYIGFAGLVAFGVVYTSARITLSERGRELASLRVLGFTRGEISYMLLAELALLVACALPLGMGLGYLLSAFVGEAFANELYRIPFVIEPATYGTSIATVIVAALVAGFSMRRRLDRLDLIAVLKTRE